MKERDKSLKPLHPGEILSEELLRYGWVGTSVSLPPTG